MRKLTNMHFILLFSALKMKNVLTMTEHPLTYSNRKFYYMPFFKQQDTLKNTPNTLNVLQEITYS